MKNIMFAVAIVFCTSCGGPEPISLERLDCMKRMQLLWEQVSLYMDDYVGYPPVSSVDKNGRDLYSWRFLVAVLRTPLLVDHPKEPWPSPVYELWETGYANFARLLFSARGFGEDGSPNPNNTTDFLALVGPGTAFTEYCADKDPRTRKVEPDAILLVECVSDIHWIQPGDIEIDSILGIHF